MNTSNVTKQFHVLITADIQTSLSGFAPVYAYNADEAVSKVQAQIDAETLDGDIDMEDSDSGYTMSYADLTRFFGRVCEIDEGGVEVDEDEEVDPADVLEDDVRQLQATICWDSEKRTRLKAFLGTLTEMPVSVA